MTGKEVVDRMMNEVMNNPLAYLLYWQGKGRMHGFGKLRLAKTIKDSPKISKMKEAETEVIIRNWLKYASDRNGGMKRRSNKNSTTCQPAGTDIVARLRNLSSSESD